MTTPINKVTFSLRWKALNQPWNTATTPKSFASLGFVNPRRTLRNQAASIVSLLAEGLAVDAAPILPYLASVQIYQTINGVTNTWFLGVVTRTPSQGNKSSEQQSYEISDPWWFLDETVYQQQWVISLQTSGTVAQWTTNSVTVNGAGKVTACAAPGVAGTGYSNGAYVFFTDSLGIGYGAYGTITVNGSGGINGVVIVNGGLGYTPGNPSVNTTPGNPGPYRDHCFINQFVFHAVGSGGYYLPQTTGFQIGDVFTYLGVVATRNPLNIGGASFWTGPMPLQIGTIPNDANFVIPTSEVRSQTCGEVLQLQFRWMPDAVTWFDYSTVDISGNPSATLHIARQQDMINGTLNPSISQPGYVNIPLVGGAGVSSLVAPQINPRYDLMRDVVVLNFEITNSITNGSNQTNWTTVVQQVYPVPPGYNSASYLPPAGALVTTIALQGVNQTNTTANLTIGKVSSATTNLQTDPWWQQKQGWLNNTNVISASIQGTLSLVDINGTPVGPWPTGATGYPNELLSGQVAPWMIEQDSTATKDVYCFLTGVIAYTTLNPSGVPSPLQGISDIAYKQFSIPLRMTNAGLSNIAGIYNYSTWASFQTPEQVPVGLAQSLYQGIGFINYDGELHFVQQECTTGYRPGMVLNITGSKSNIWGNINAVIQEVQEDLETGETTVRFGPPRHLGSTDLIDLLRTTRFRYIFVNPSAQYNAQESAASQTQLGDGTALSGASESDVQRQSLGVEAVWPAGGAIPPLTLPPGMGQLLSTVPKPPATTPIPTTAHPSQGIGGSFGAALVAYQIGQSTPTPQVGNLAVPAATMDPITGNPVSIGIFLADCKDSNGVWRQIWVQETALCDPLTNTVKHALFVRSAIY